MTTGTFGSAARTGGAGPPARPADPPPAAAALTVRRLLNRSEPYLFVAPTALILVAVLIYPVFYTVEISLSRFQMATFGPGDFVGLQHYRSTLADPNFWTSVRVTLVYLAAALPIQMVLGFALGYLLSIDWLGKSVVRALFIVPMVVAPIVAGSVWKMLLDPLWGTFSYYVGLFGVPAVNWFGTGELAMFSIVLIDTWRWTPFVILMSLAGILGLPAEPFEAAEIDGAGPWQRLVHIAIPLLMPVILATLIVRWLNAIKMFDIIYATTKGGPSNATEVVNLYVYDVAFKLLAFDKAAAMSTILVVVSLIVTVVYVRVSAATER